MKKNAVAINLSEEEYKKAEEAMEYGVLPVSMLFKLLIKMGLDELEESSEFTFCFDKSQIIDKTTYKTVVVRLDRQQYQAMTQVCKSTPFSMSSLAKYFIMPKVNQMVEKKKWILNL